jgi:NAD(P)-dependent dehydrogenase (short-subunit alcohol dehydrogenase family)
MTRTALVTGASAGIGAATVKRLMKDGYVVYAAARRVDRMEDLRGAGAHLVGLDLTDDASIVAAIEKIRSETGRLDVLVNNAGYGSYGALERTFPWMKRAGSSRSTFSAPRGSVNSLCR